MAPDENSRTDYLGDTPSGDALVEEAGPTELTRYAGFAWQTLGQGGATRYLHADLIGSAVMTSGTNGAAVSTVAYSAFGEVLKTSGAPGGVAPSDFPRYQYAGGYGYESGLLSVQGVNTSLPPITLQHLGARWYQPDLGRFVQRDPIGLAGGSNAYAYCLNDPCAGLDPQGLTKGGKQQIVPSDLPPNWPHMTPEARGGWLRSAIANAKSPAHKAVLKGFLKVGKRLGWAVCLALILLDPPQTMAEAVDDATGMFFPLSYSELRNLLEWVLDEPMDSTLGDPLRPNPW